ncbi:MAG: M56 family metallopeptidase, partial [Salegentibacter sp.]
MEEFLIHICKSAGLLSIFYIAYLVLLRKETTFMKNRIFLAAGIVTSLILPAIYFTREVIIKAPLENTISAESFRDIDTVPAEALELSWWQIAGFLYLLVTLFFLTRLCLHLFAILKMMRKHKSTQAEGLQYFEIGEKTGAFSFFKNVFYNPQDHSQQELKMVLQHEKIHARQLHSLDIMLANVCTAILWFNPLSWFYRKSIEQNLEFLADRETVNSTASKQAYQQALLKTSLPELQLSLTNKFYQSSLKKRIVMLNKRNSGNGKFWKGSLVLPLILAFMLAFNVKTEARIMQQSTSEAPVASEAISAYITKKTTKSELQEFEKEFARHDVKLDFDHVKYSSEDILTRIDISVKDKNTGNKGSLSRKNPEGIEPIDIVIGKNGQISLGSAKKVEIEETTATSGKQRFRIIDHASITSRDDKPLVIIDGVPQKNREAMDSLSPSVVKEVNVLRGVKATALYGSRGSNGVIIVTTKTDDSRAPKVEIEKRLTVIDSAENNEGDIYA